VGVEVPRPLVPDVLEELHQEERGLRVRRSEPEVLVEPAGDLVVQVDVEELPHRPRLRDVVREVQARHVLMGDLRVHADHLGVLQRLDEREHRADGGEVDVGPRLVRLRLQREPQIVPLVLHVPAEEVHPVRVPAERLERVLRGVGLDALAATPEHVRRRAELDAEVDRRHRLADRVRAHARVVRGEGAVAEHRVAEQVRGRHRDDEPRGVQRLREVGHDPVPLVRVGVDRDEIVVVQVHAPRTDFGQQLHELHGSEHVADRVAERVEARVADRPQAEREAVLGLRLQAHRMATSRPGSKMLLTTAPGTAPLRQRVHQDRRQQDHAGDDELQAL
jgi:hypothetical protein